MPENLETLKLILLPILREHGLKLTLEDALGRKKRSKEK